MVLLRLNVCSVVSASLLTLHSPSFNCPRAPFGGCDCLCLPWLSYSSPSLHPTRFLLLVALLVYWSWCLLKALPHYARLYQQVSLCALRVSCMFVLPSTMLPLCRGSKSFLLCRRPPGWNTSSQPVRLARAASDVLQANRHESAKQLRQSAQHLLLALSHNQNTYMMITQGQSTAIKRFGRADSLQFMAWGQTA